MILCANNLDDNKCFDIGLLCFITFQGSCITIFCFFSTLEGIISQNLPDSNVTDTYFIFKTYDQRMKYNTQQYVNESWKILSFHLIKFGNLLFSYYNYMLQIPKPGARYCKLRI